MSAVSAVDAPRRQGAGIVRDLVSVSERALRSISRDPETTIPALVIPVFMFAMTVGALEDFARNIRGSTTGHSSCRWQ